MSKNKFKEGDWIRTCQECDYTQKDIMPDYEKELPNAYAYRKCKRCRSEALDYGKVYTIIIIDEHEDE